MSRPRDKRLPYLPGVDALRAIAVLAVFAYHAGVGWMPGGFLGVDVFFVISGYLITSLLLGEFRRAGRVSLWRFWLRRARRLLPAVGVLIAVVMVAAAFLTPESVPQLRGDAIASLGYFANWHFVFDQQSYFEQFQRPSLLRHLWSLSVEEQFYLFWPLVFAAGMSLFGRRRLLLGVLAGAAGSVALAWVLFDPAGDASRVYYGTDTHAVGLLAGVALALVWEPARLRSAGAGRWAGPALDVVGVLALGYVVLAFMRVHDYDLALWHGGYAWLALASAALIGVLAHPAARLGRILGNRPLVWLGLRSYSFYLWHWPVLALTRPGVDVSMPRGILIPLQLLATLALADLSYRFVETPFGARGAIARLPARLGRLTRPALAAAVLGVVLLIGWSGIVPGGAGRRLGAAAASTSEFARVRVSYHPHAATAKGAGRAGPASDGAAGSSGAGGVSDGAAGSSGAGGATGDPGASRPGPPPRIVAIGDSVMVGARDQLAHLLGPRFSMNARIGRQEDDFVKLVHHLRANHRHPDALVVQMGNNGPLYSDEMDVFRHYARGVGHLFLVTDTAPVSWQDESNDAIRAAAAEWPDTRLIDWHAIAGRDGYTWDGIHLTPKGARAYAALAARDVLAVVGPVRRPAPVKRAARSRAGADDRPAAGPPGAHRRRTRRARRAGHPASPAHRTRHRAHHPASPAHRARHRAHHPASPSHRPAHHPASRSRRARHRAHHPASPAHRTRHRAHHPASPAHRAARRWTHRQNRAFGGPRRG
ncbi:MAG: acyltransferase family protein [Solirubrobacterales bacterium]